MFFKLVLKGFKLKKGWVLSQKMAQPVQSDEEPVDLLCSSGRVPVEGGQKVSLFPNDLLFLVEVRLRPMVTCQAFNANDQSTGRPLARPIEPPNGQFGFFSSIKSLQTSLFKKLNLPKSFLIIYEPWKSIFLVHHYFKTCISLVHHSILFFYCIFEPKVLLLGFL